MPSFAITKFSAGLSLLSIRKLKLPLPFIANAYFFHKKGYRYVTGGLPSNDFPILENKPEIFMDKFSPGLYPSQHGAVVSVARSKLFVNMHSNSFIDPRFDQNYMRSLALSHNFLTYVELKSRCVASRYFSFHAQHDLWDYQSYMPTPIYVHVKGKLPMRHKLKWKGIRITQSLFERYYSKRNIFSVFKQRKKKLRYKQWKKQNYFFKYWLRMNDYLKWFVFYPKKKPFFSIFKLYK